MDDTSTRWWSYGVSEGDQIRVSLTNAIHSIHSDQAGRASKLLDYLRLYAGRYISGFDAAALYGVRAYASLDEEKLRMNVIQEVVDTIASRIAKQRPRPMFLTRRGAWEEQQQAKDLSDWSEAAIDACEVYERIPTWVTDAGIFGDGIAKVAIADDRVVVERCFPHEIFVDMRDGRHSKPRSMYQVHEVDRDQLADVYKAKRAEIMDADSALLPDAMFGFSRDNANIVQVVEAWHLRSSEGAGDGRHVLICGNTILTPRDEREWNGRRFPFARWSWHRPQVGFWGVGASERLIPEQYEINLLLQRVQQSMRAIAKPTVILPRSSGIPTGHITNQVATILQTNSGPPIVLTPQSVHPEVFGQIDRLRMNAYRKEGLAESAMSGQVPAGLESGKAIRLQNNIETDRLGIKARDVERFVLDIAELCIAAGRELIESSASNKKLSWSLITRDQKRPRKLDLADIELAEDAYRVTCFPVSALSNDPAGRIDDIQSLMNAGMLSPELGRKLLDMPDLDAENELDFAPIDYIDAHLAAMLRDKEPEYEPPAPWQNLALTKDRTQKALQRAELDGAPEDRLDLVRRYLEDTLAMEAAAMPPAPPPAAELPPSPDMPAAA